MLEATTPEFYTASVSLGKEKLIYKSNTLTHSVECEKIMTEFRKNLILVNHTLFGKRDEKTYRVMGDNRLQLTISGKVKMVINLKEKEEVERYMTNCFSVLGRVEGTACVLIRRSIFDKLFYVMVEVFDMADALNSMFYNDVSKTVRPRVLLCKSDLDDLKLFNRFFTLDKELK